MNSTYNDPAYSPTEVRLTQQSLANNGFRNAYRAAGLEMLPEEVPFAGQSALEIKAASARGAAPDVEIDRASPLCAFYICKLPFVRC